MTNASDNWCEKCRRLRETCCQDPTPEPGHLRQVSGEGETMPWPGTRIETTKCDQYRCEDPACNALWFRVETENDDFVEWVPVPWCAGSIARGRQKDVWAGATYWL